MEKLAHVLQACLVCLIVVGHLVVDFVMYCHPKFDFDINETLKKNIYLLFVFV